LNNKKKDVCEDVIIIVRLRIYNFLHMFRSKILEKKGIKLKFFKSRHVFIFKAGLKMNFGLQAIYGTNG
jgi:hypothetical protein